MSISSSTRKAGPYSCNGSTVAFPFSFKVFQTSDVRVVLTDANDIESDLVLGTNYTVSLNADQDANPGGTVTTTATYATGYLITLTSQLQNLQPVTLTNQGGFYPKVINTALDRLTILVQQVVEQVGRAVKTPISSGLSPDQLIADLYAVEANAGNSAAAAANSAANSAASAAAAAAVLDNFDDRYLGQKTADPSLDNDGNPLQIGALYYNTVVGVMRVYTGTGWIDAATGVSSDDVSFLPGGSGVVPSDVQTKLREIISVKDFGAKGDGTTNDTAAFNAAIAYANSKGGNDRANIIGTTIFIPEGRYKITAALNPITVSSVAFVGASKSSAVLLLSSTGNAFTFGDSTMANAPVGGGMRSVKIEYPAGPSGTASVFAIDYAFSLNFEDLMLENIGTLARLGETSSRIAGGMFFRNIQGSIANAGFPLFNLRYGAGLTVSDSSVFVRGVVAPVHPAAMTTTYGTHVFKCDTGFWDTLQVSNCLFERFDMGVACSSGASMTYQNMYFSNTIFDYFRRWPIYLEAAGGNITNVQTNETCWFVSWEESCIYLTRSAGIHDNHRFAGNCVIAGKFGVYYNIANAKSIHFHGLQVSGCDRLGGVAQGAMTFNGGAKGFTVTSCRGNHDTTSHGLPWRCDYGIVVGADCDEYVVSDCYFEGDVGGYSFAANSAGSSKRRASNNANANYAGYAGTAIPASGVRYTNKSPFVEEWTFAGGTITVGYDKNLQGIPGALGYVHFRLQPNDTFAVGYSAAPTVRVFIEP